MQENVIENSSFKMSAIVSQPVDSLCLWAIGLNPVHTRARHLKCTYVLIIYTWNNQIYQPP